MVIEPDNVPLFDSFTVSPKADIVLLMFPIFVFEEFTNMSFAEILLPGACIVELELATYFLANRLTYKDALTIEPALAEKEFTIVYVVVVLLIE